MAQPGPHASHETVMPPGPVDGWTGLGRNAPERGCLVVGDRSPGSDASARRLLEEVLG